MVTKYAFSQDRFNARREFNEKVLPELADKGKLNMHEVQLRLSLNHCVTDDFTQKLCEQYAKANLLIIEGDYIVRA